jgi:hypothetical protein
MLKGKPTETALGTMASKHQMTGMLGVYLVAAELSRLGFIVSPTSRSARGADLLVTDQECRKAWSVQVKTNSKPARFWLVNRNAETLISASHVYVFVNLRGSERPEYVVVPSSHVASNLSADAQGNWCSFYRKDRLVEDEGWAIFDDPYAGPDAEEAVSHSDEF